MGLGQVDGQLSVLQVNCHPDHYSVTVIEQDSQPADDLAVAGMSWVKLKVSNLRQEFCLKVFNLRV